MATKTPDPEMASCECIHALRDHARRECRPCIVCDCPMFLWSGSYYESVD